MMLLEHFTEELLDELYDVDTSIAEMYIDQLNKWLTRWVYYRTRATRVALLKVIRLARKYLYY